MSDLFTRLQQTLGDAYRLERELGGGMSRVFVAEEVALGRRVVIKVLPPEMAAGVSTERFRREIQLAASLQHPHIVPLLSAGSSGDLLYYVMPLVEGESLRGRLVRGGEQPVANVVRVLKDVATALSYAHARGVVHRDIKPDNILLSGDFALVTDFGVAKAVSEATGEAHLTSLGVALGTPSYMAPEQAAADPHADHRIDVYALGAVAYEMLTGRPPFVAPNPQMVLAAHVTQAPEPVTQHRASVPPALAGLVMRCLEKKPADRWQSADEIVYQLAAMATPSAGHVPTTAVPAVRDAWRPRVARRGAVAAAFVLGLATLASVAFLRGRAGSAYDTKRVAVTPFENQTRDPTLDPVGKMAADWITQGIVQAGVAEVIGAATSSVSNAGRDVIRDADAAQQSRPATTVRGRYYLDTDSLRFQAELVETRTGRVIRALEPVTAGIRAPMPAIDRMRDRVVGALATLNAEGLEEWARTATAIPTFDAYQEYLAGVEAIGPRSGDRAAQTARIHFLRAFELDSTFVLAALAAVDVSTAEEAEPLLARLERMRPRLSQIDRTLVDQTRAEKRGDRTGALRAARQLAAIAPGRRAWLGVAAAALMAGRPHETLVALERADPDWNIRIAGAWGDRTDALHHVADYRRELAAVKRRAELGLEDMYDEVQIYATLGNEKEVNRRIEERVRLPKRETDTPANLMWFAAREYTAHGHAAQGRALVERAIAWLETVPPDEMTAFDSLTLARSLHHAGRWREARDAFSALARGGMRSGVGQRAAGTRVNPYSFTPPMIVGSIGAAAAFTGDTSAAVEVLAELARVPRGARAEANYERARISAVLGRRDQAVALIQQALAGGLPYGMWFHRDIEFHPHRDYAPMKALLNPEH